MTTARQQPAARTPRPCEPPSGGDRNRFGQAQAIMLNINHVQPKTATRSSHCRAQGRVLGSQSDCPADEVPPSPSAAPHDNHGRLRQGNDRGGTPAVRRRRLNRICRQSAGMEDQNRPGKTFSAEETLTTPRVRRPSPLSIIPRVTAAQPRRCRGASSPQLLSPYGLQELWAWYQALPGWLSSCINSLNTSVEMQVKRGAKWSEEWGPPPSVAVARSSMRAGSVGEFARANFRDLIITSTSK